MVTVIIIGCGNYQPIQTYTEATESPYPIYGNPSADLYKLFGFSVNLSPSKKGEERKYTSTLGSQFNRVWDALKAGPMKNIGHVSSVGPKSQNGGEMILEAGQSFCPSLLLVEECILIRVCDRWNMLIHVSDAKHSGPHGSRRARQSYRSDIHPSF